MHRLPGFVVDKLIELKSDQGFVENRRWFSSSEMDLIVWSDETRSIRAFELYYDKNVNEHVLIWRQESGYSHLAVDDGEQKPVLNYKEAPILIPDGVIDPDRIVRLFERQQDGLPVAIAKDIGEKLSGLVTDIQKS